MINFRGPEVGHRPAALAMEDVVAMDDGPTAGEVVTAVEVETRALEVREQENAHWREYFRHCNSRLVPLCDGDLVKIFELSERVRSELFKGLTPEMVREHLQRCLDPKNRVVVVLRPQRPLWRRMLFPDPRTTEGAAVMACGGVAAVGAWAYLRHRRPPRRSRSRRHARRGEERGTGDGSG